jgi:hypothetical protein
MQINSLTFLFLLPCLVWSCLTLSFPFVLFFLYVGGYNLEEWIAEGEEEERKDEKKGTKGGIDHKNNINSNQNAKMDHLNNSKKNLNGNNSSGSYLSQDNKDKNSTSNSSSSSNYNNITKNSNSNSNYTPVAAQKPLQSTLDFRVVFLGKPFDMVILHPVV